MVETSVKTCSCIRGIGKGAIMAAFFSPEEKRLAGCMKASELKQRYEASEKRLKCAAQSGSEQRVRRVMKSHHKWEYALLYQKIQYSKRRKQK